MDRKEETSSNEGDVMEATVNALAEESDQNIDLEEYVNEGVDECNLTKSRIKAVRRYSETFRNFIPTILRKVGQR